MKVQLVFFDGCPNAKAARDALTRALEAEGMAVEFEEIDSQSESAPADLRGWGSPTVLINGVDVTGERIPMARHADSTKTLTTKACHQMSRFVGR